MPLRAAFAETDITPPIGTGKIGWIKRQVAERILDPLMARCCVLEAGGRAVAFVSLDTLSVRWTQTAEIRRRATERPGLAGAGVMVSATHNHAGPAIVHLGDVPRDEAYAEMVVTRVADMLGRAAAGLEPAEVGFGWAFEFDIPRNRRVIMRDGTVQTHGSFRDPNALCFEGPVDPEVAVMGVRDEGGRPLGTIINFTCHPTHHGDGGDISGGYPGALARQMQARGWPVTVFLNGACGNVQHSDPAGRRPPPSAEEIASRLAGHAETVLSAMRFSPAAELGSAARTIQLPYRTITPQEIAGTVRGAQRFVDPAAYDRDIPRLLERIRRRGAQPAEVQAIRINDVAVAGVPAEYFVQLGLRIKEQSHPRHALVVSHANGMVGYVPHKEAFLRGGYETTFAGSSRLAPEAGDLLADKAVELIRKGP